MAKKAKRTGKTPSRGTSVSALRAERTTSALTKGFAEWCEETQGFPAHTALALLEPVEALAGTYFESTPSAV